VDFFHSNTFSVTREKIAEAIIEEAGMTVQTEIDRLKEDGGSETGIP
jgi:hypothetical protein